jgi:hypothetical protein
MSKRDDKERRQERTRKRLTYVLITIGVALSWWQC